MKNWRAGCSMIALALLQACAGDDDVRDQVRVVGSSTVYPFAQLVAEKFIRANPGFKSPIIEATGTGGGMKLFCDGVGSRFPDIVNASRRMKASEFDDCARNGAKDISEIQIGLDGVSLGEARGGLNMRLSVRDVYAALAAQPFGRPQSARSWADVNPALPQVPILIYGPPSTSGTRDALAELILTKGCDADPAMKALKKSNSDEHKKICTTVREDGAYVDAGENDNLIVQKINANPRALGVFGFSFLEENRDKLRDVPLDGVEATYETISDFSYPGARPLYIYVKKAHARAIPGLQEFVGEFANGITPHGYLRGRGMIVAPANVVAQSVAAAKSLPSLDPAALK